MACFKFLNKQDFCDISNELFNILADNMTVIAPTGNSREDDYKLWYGCLLDSLPRDERQIILIQDDDKIIGYFQYCINSDTLVMEEIQFKSEYHGKGIFRELYGFLLSNIKTDLIFVEAYASVNNAKSIGILGKFGLLNVGLNKNGRSYHFKGKYELLKKWYENY